MSTMSDLATNLAEYGGPWHRHAGWVARDAAGQLVDGYRYAVLVPCGRAGCPGPDECPVCVWQYAGRAFAADDAATVLAEVVASTLFTADGRRIAGFAAAGGTS